MVAALGAGFRGAGEWLDGWMGFGLVVGDWERGRVEGSGGPLGTCGR